jgi:hypothetical protein
MTRFKKVFNIAIIFILIAAFILPEWNCAYALRVPMSGLKRMDSLLRAEAKKSILVFEERQILGSQYPKGRPISFKDDEESIFFFNLENLTMKDIATNLVPVLEYLGEKDLENRKKTRTSRKSYEVILILNIDNGKLLNIAVSPRYVIIKDGIKKGHAELLEHFKLINLFSNIIGTYYRQAKLCRVSLDFDTKTKKAVELHITPPWEMNSRDDKQQYVRGLELFAAIFSAFGYTEKDMEKIELIVPDSCETVLRDLGVTKKQLRAIAIVADSQFHSFPNIVRLYQKNQLKQKKAESLGRAKAAQILASGETLKQELIKFVKVVNPIVSRIVELATTNVGFDTYDRKIAVSEYPYGCAIGSIASKHMLEKLYGDRIKIELIELSHPKMKELEIGMHVVSIIYDNITGKKYFMSFFEGVWNDSYPYERMREIEFYLPDGNSYRDFFITQEYAEWFKKQEFSPKFFEFIDNEDITEKTGLTVLGKYKYEELKESELTLIFSAIGSTVDFDSLRFLLNRSKYFTTKTIRTGC